MKRLMLVTLIISTFATADSTEPLSEVDQLLNATTFARLLISEHLLSSGSPIPKRISQMAERSVRKQAPPDLEMSVSVSVSGDGVTTMSYVHSAAGPTFQIIPVNISGSIFWDCVVVSGQLPWGTRICAEMQEHVGSALRRRQSGE